MFVTLVSSRGEMSLASKLLNYYSIEVLLICSKLNVSLNILNLPLYEFSLVD